MMESDGATAARERDNTVFAVLIAISFCHLLNDMMQSLLPAIYPKESDARGGNVALVFPVIEALARGATPSLLWLQ